MVRTKKQNVFIAVIVLLIIICSLQGWFIFRHLNGRSPEKDIFSDTKRFSSFLEKQFRIDRDRKWNLFDRFFDDDFFSSRPDPFEEMRQLHNRFESMMSESSRKMFKDSWNDWFEDRFFGGSKDIDIRTDEKDDVYLITIGILNLKENNLNININAKGISVEGNFSQTIEKTDGNGKVIRKQEVRQRLSKLIPIPGDADADNAKIDHEKDKILISLPKKKS